MMESVQAQILTGDCLEVLPALPAGSVHCCITSYPYWGLRAYLDADDPLKPLEIGLEPTFEIHLKALLEVFGEVKRVLRDDGTLWLNGGDAYACDKNGRSAADTKAAGNDDRTFRDKPISTVTWRPGGRRGEGSAQTASNRNGTPVSPGFKPKDLMLMPFRVAMALQADGWYLRSAITLCRLNPMPESARDRPTSATEMLFLFAKSPRYYFDQEALRPLAKTLCGGRQGNILNWWTLSSQPLRECHYAAFNEKLVEPCILASCPPDGVVLDPFLGSGTTCRVATRLGRRSIGIELKPEYCTMARKRNRQLGMGL